MSSFLKLLPVILGALPNVIQLVENAFGGSAPSKQAHQDAVVKLLTTLVHDVTEIVPNSPEAKLAEKIVNDVAAAAVSAWYDVKGYLASQQPAPAPTASK